MPSRCTADPAARMSEHAAAHRLRATVPSPVKPPPARHNAPPGGARAPHHLGARTPCLPPPAHLAMAARISSSRGESSAPTGVIGSGVGWLAICSSTAPVAFGMMYLPGVEVAAALGRQSRRHVTR
eukprot:6495205-Prymnesium_polylepis.1